MAELKPEITTKQLETFYREIRKGDSETKVSRIEAAAFQLRCAKTAGFFDGEIDIDNLLPKHTYKLALNLAELLADCQTIDPE